MSGLRSVWRPAAALVAVLALLNLAPYLFRAWAANAVRLSVREVTGPDGLPLDLVDRGRAVTRHLARKAAEAIGLTGGEPEPPSAFIVKAALDNQSPFEIALLRANYQFHFDGARMASGEWRREEPLNVAASERVVLSLPIETTVGAADLIRWGRERRLGVVHGDAWLRAGAWQWRCPFRQTIAF